MKKLKLDDSVSTSTTFRRRGYLAHLERSDAAYFVTIRTADAISFEEIAKLKISRFTPDEKRESVTTAFKNHLDRHNEVEFCGRESQKWSLRRSSSGMASSTIYWPGAYCRTTYTWYSS